ncbi:hypothetical protein PQ478_08290 [Alkalihalophilus pseudofirmus]|uniref:hypothetical protein n=1 Tax=Alkalihalophilus pseudofirmus TaxID=79885 RepID=UPI00259BD1BE|nr:hypothetical protein [Alkalihalophilus pseudofirmus]WEG18467.1 hypothetical protein PQ478_08290 [Alkalihalophilus pseudofirmus]
MDIQCQQDCRIRSEMVSHQIKVLNDRVDDLSALKTQNVRMDTLLEIQMTTMKDMQGTMSNLNTTLNHINTSQQVMGENLNNLNSTVTNMSERVDVLEKKTEQKKESSNSKDDNFVKEHYKIILFLVAIIASLLGVASPF